LSELPFDFELLIFVCSIAVFGLIVGPTTQVFATPEKTAASSSIKETIDQVVSDTLNGMMEDTINSVLQNTSHNLKTNDNRSNTGFQNRLPSSVDIAQITGNATRAQETKSTEPDTPINIENNDQKTKSNATNEGLITQQNESVRLTDTPQNPLNSSNIDINNSNSEYTKNQTSSNDVRPTNFIDDLIYKVRQLFFK